MASRPIFRLANVSLVLATLAGTPAWAELIIGSEKPLDKPAVSGARSQRERASSFQKNSPTPVIVIDDESGGVLAPRGGAPAEERAYENRARAKSYQSSGDSSMPLPLPGGAGLPGMDGTTAGRAADQRGRARAYTGSGNARDIDLSNVGRDGIPIVPCHNVDNVSGRIGDDSLSGSLVFIIRNGQQVKVRCQ